MNQPKKKSSFDTLTYSSGIGLVMALAANMTPECIMDAVMKKRGYKKRKDEGDVERLAKAAEKRQRRAQRNLRNAARMADGEAIAKGLRA